MYNTGSFCIEKLMQNPEIVCSEGNHQDQILGFVSERISNVAAVRNTYLDLCL